MEVHLMEVLQDARLCTFFLYLSMLQASNYIGQMFGSVL